MITGIKGSCSPTKIKARASLVERQNFNMVKKQENMCFGGVKTALHIEMKKSV